MTGAAGGNQDVEDGDVAMRPVPEYDIGECRAALRSLWSQIQATEPADPIGAALESPRNNNPNEDANEVARQAQLRTANGELTQQEVTYAAVLKRLEKIVSVLQGNLPPAHMHPSLP